MRPSTREYRYFRAENRYFQSEILIWLIDYDSCNFYFIFLFRISKLGTCLIHFVRFLEISGLVFKWNLSKFFFSIIKISVKSIRFISVGVIHVNWHFFGGMSHRSHLQPIKLRPFWINCQMHCWGCVKSTEVHKRNKLIHNQISLKWNSLKNKKKNIWKTINIFLNSEKKGKNRKWIKTDGTKRLKMVKE